ncbi:3-oxoacyl-ACP synthase III family protein [Marinicella litoralis]|uniref:3-oxoacyl-[acyl-carrier-protein] synthase-3 n=1 Tax=Marinicella litoralis TaxID=644220 RepID=A0A4R6XRM6_9GAMM|nr:ketoacyl-ACP synthase III [Marinicella litoralis]TDR22552.1 3-oxoacyl-[acyl-carrier-protein] synthase-3 [Marinicella litoralis]
MLYIHGAGHYHPSNVIDNAFLESLDIGTTDDWIIERVGIQKRHTVMNLNDIKTTHNRSVGESQVQINSAQMGAKAITMALARAGISKDEVGMVLAASCSPTYSLPANACVIAQACEIDAFAVDISSACSSFAAHMHFLNNMQAAAVPDYVVCVIPESWTTTTDYSDRRTAVLIGDGAAAVVVSKKHVAAMKIKHTTMTSNPEAWEKVQTKTGHHFFQEGLSVQKFAIKKTIETFKLLAEQSALPLNQHYFISHQANLTMLKSVCKKLKIADEKHLFNVDQYGNCGAAGAPSVLSQNWDQFKAGDHITLVVVGAGLTWGGMQISVDETNQTSSGANHAA